MSSSYAKSLLVTYFDPFGGSPANNSKTVATELKKLMPDYDIETCQLRTVYDVAFNDLEDCVNMLAKKPDLVISLGEASCEVLRYETRGINLDNGSIADNNGHRRRMRPISSGGEQFLGSSAPIDKVYCRLPREAKKNLSLSTSAGSFVCNNTMYHSLEKLDMAYSFIHVPNSSCSYKNSTVLETLIPIVRELLKEDLELVHALPISKAQAEYRLRGADACESEFLERLLVAY